MKRFLICLFCLCLLGASCAGAEEILASGGSAFSFTPEDLTLHAFVQAMNAEHQRYHSLQGQMFEANYDLTDGTKAKVEFPGGTPLSIFACMEYQDDVTRPLAKKAGEIDTLFTPIFLLAQTISLEPNAYFPLNLEKFEGRYNRDVFLGISQDRWWASAELSAEGDTMLIVPTAAFDSRQNIIDDTIYVMCIYYHQNQTTVWFCADSYINYALLTAVKPPKTQGGDVFAKWWDGQQDYRDAVAESPTGEAAWRVAYAQAINEMMYPK